MGDRGNWPYGAITINMSGIQTLIGKHLCLLVAEGLADKIIQKRVADTIRDLMLSGF